MEDPKIEKRMPLSQPRRLDGLDLELKNFKSFKDSGTVRLAPITLVYGENSVGKSSIVQAIMALCGSEYERGLKLETPSLAIRSFGQVARNDSDTFSIKASVTPGALRRPGRSWFSLGLDFWNNHFIELSEELVFAKSENNSDLFLKSINYSGLFDGSHGQRTIPLGRIDRRIKKSPDAGWIRSRPSLFVAHMNTRVAAGKRDWVDTLPETLNYYQWVAFPEEETFWELMLDEISEWKEAFQLNLQHEAFNLEAYKEDIVISPQGRAALLTNLFDSASSGEVRDRYAEIFNSCTWGTTEGERFLRLHGRSGENKEMDIRQILAGFSSGAYDLFMFDDFVDIDIPWLTDLPLVFDLFWQNLEYRYLGAYRERVPDLVQKRLSSSVDASDGSALGEGKLRSFLAETMELLNLPYSVEIEFLQDTDYFKVWLVERQPNSKFNRRRHPSDVGFGVGQIVQMLTNFHLGLPDESSTKRPNARHQPVAIQVIEEPEAHLHPSLQRRLATILNPDFMNGSNFIIETHSEALILGYLEMIKSGKLRAAELSVILVESEEGESIAKSFEITEEGEFADGWPPSLFPIGG